ncbi:hypothetical protein ABID26_004520 [Mesorhizobium shonense]|uniref:Uncharacterized protein n=1 Tax=Mesorhizobium shonense TaxID=1209948 RepID=A0ABV2HX11_9HYPH
MIIQAWPAGRRDICLGGLNQVDAITAKVLRAVLQSFITLFDRGDIKD